MVGVRFFFFLVGSINLVTDFHHELFFGEDDRLI